jgi:hypothetical protein
MREAQASDHFTEPNCFNVCAFASIIPIVSILGVASDPLTFWVRGAIINDSSPRPLHPRVRLFPQQQFCLDGSLEKRGSTAVIRFYRFPYGSFEMPTTRNINGFAPLFSIQ